MAESERWAHNVTTANGIEIHYVEAGDGPLALLLHGFPEFWYSWREQIDALADAGYRVVAPDMRGYNRTDKPTGVSAYAVDTLVEDVTGLVSALGYETARLVGHDWGGFVAWETAMQQPDVVDRLVSIGVTHPACFDSSLDQLRQFANAWYMYFFRLPRLPEFGLRRNDFDAHEQMVHDLVVNEDAFDEEDFERYRQAMAQDGALTAMVNYYRANTGRNFLRKLVAPRFGATQVRTTSFTWAEVTVPTMVLWGAHDVFDEDVMFDGLDEWVPKLQRKRFSEASHWPHLEQPERANDALVAFLEDEVV